MRLLTAVVPLLCALTLGGCDASTSGTDEGSASCALAVVVDGTTYVASYAVDDPSLTSNRIDASIPACDDTGGQEDPRPAEQIVVREFAEVSPEQALWWEGQVLLPLGTELSPQERKVLRAEDGDGASGGPVGG